MWRIDRFTRRQARLDFTSSGQAHHDVTQVMAGDVVFANAVELTQWTEPTQLQLLVCESCGVEHCEPGGWLSVRSAGEYVIFLPRFDAMREDEWGRNEYAPPPFVSMLGIPLIDSSAYASLRGHCPGLPIQAQLRALSGVELLHALQWEAPRNALGRFPAWPAIEETLVMAASENAPENVVAVLGDLVEDTRKSESIVMRPMTVGEREIELYLDGFGSPVWRPIVATPRGEYRLCPTPGVVAERRPSGPAGLVSCVT